MAVPSNPNLLDNWYFIGGGSQLGNCQLPINQRGLTNHNTTGEVYTIDRWRKTNGINSIALESDDILVNGRTGGAAIDQLTTTWLKAGTVVTISALLKLDEGATKGGVQITLRDNNGSLSYPTLDEEWYSPGEWVVVSQTTTLSSDGFIGGRLRATGNVRFKAAKLELGDRQTLAYKLGDQWILNSPPNYIIEFDKCRRYYRKYIGTDFNGHVTSNAKDVCIQISDLYNMIKRPSAKFQGDIIIRGISGYPPEASNDSPYGSPVIRVVWNNGIVFNRQDGTAWGLPNNTPISVDLGSTNILELSADL